jgi:hypothetical protein
MKPIILSILAFLFSCTPAFSLIYNYEFQGQITYSDYDATYGYDPFVDVRNTTFRIFGKWGDLGTEAYTTINGKTFANEGFPLDAFDSQRVGDDFDVLIYNGGVVPHPLGIWHIHGFDTSQQLISNDGSINWNMFSSLDWQILHVAVVHNDPTLWKYWEYDGIITSASLAVSPVPEPATLILYGIGIVIIVSRRLRLKSSPYFGTKQQKYHTN